MKRSRKDYEMDNESEEKNNESEEKNKESDKSIEEVSKEKINDHLKNMADRVDKGLPISVKDYKTLEDIKEAFPTFFDEDSGNSSNKREGLEQLLDYLDYEFESQPNDKKASKVLDNIYQEWGLKKQKKDTIEEPSQGSSSTGSSSTENKNSLKNEDPLKDLPTEMPSIFDDID